MQIEDEWDRVEIFSDILFGVDSLIYLIDDALDDRADVIQIWIELDEDTLEILGWDKEPPLPWSDEIFHAYWTARAKAYGLILRWHH